MRQTIQFIVDVLYDPQQTTREEASKAFVAKVVAASPPDDSAWFIPYVGEINEGHFASTITGEQMIKEAIGDPDPEDLV